MHAVIPYVIAALLFALGVYGVLRRRNAILVLMAVELMLNAVNLILLAAAEVGVGLAIVLQYYRLRQAVDLDEVALHRHDHEPTEQAEQVSR